MSVRYGFCVNAIISRLRAKGAGGCKNKGKVIRRKIGRKITRKINSLGVTNEARANKNANIYPGLPSRTSRIRARKSPFENTIELLSKVREGPPHTLHSHGCVGNPYTRRSARSARFARSNSASSLDRRLPGRYGPDPRSSTTTPPHPTPMISRSLYTRHCRFFSLLNSVISQVCLCVCVCGGSAGMGGGRRANVAALNLTPKGRFKTRRESNGQVGIFPVLYAYRMPRVRLFVFVIICATRPLLR
jgi:hypothetical protein